MILRARQRRRVVAEIRRECERGRHTIWTDARWYDVLSRAEIQEIVSEYGYGELRGRGTT